MRIRIIGTEIEGWKQNLFEFLLVLLICKKSVLLSRAARVYFCLSRSISVIDRRVKLFALIILGETLHNFSVSFSSLSSSCLVQFSSSLCMEIRFNRKLFFFLLRFPFGVMKKQWRAEVAFVGAANLVLDSLLVFPLIPVRSSAFRPIPHIKW